MFRNIFVLEFENEIQLNKIKTKQKGINTMFKLNKTTATILAAVLFSMISKISPAQDNLQSILQDAIENNGKEVLQPYADALSADMNSGTFHSAKVRTRFSFYLGVKAMGTYINGENSYVKNANNSLDILPSASPELRIGAFGTEVSVRYLPQLSVGKYAAVQSFGIGLKHCITSHFKKSPIDVSLGFSKQSISLSSRRQKEFSVNASSYALNLQVSKELIGVFTIYTGVQYESTNIDMNVDTDDYDFKDSYENNNKVRGTFGLNIKLGPLNLNGDYNIGKTNTISAGFGFAY